MWGSVALLYNRNWHSIAHHLFFVQPTGKNGFTFVNGWIKSKGEYFMVCKLYGIQISVSINKVLLEHNSFLYLLSIPVSTLWWQLSSWDKNLMWHSHNTHCCLMHYKLQWHSYECLVFQVPCVLSYHTISFSPSCQNKSVLLMLSI